MNTFRTRGGIPQTSQTRHTTRSNRDIGKRALSQEIQAKPLPKGSGGRSARSRRTEATAGGLAGG